MKTFVMFAVVALATISATAPALAANSCKDEIASVEKNWGNHRHESIGGQAQSWKSVGQALDHAKADCAAGKEREAFETINLVHRWLGSKEHTKH